MGAKVAVEGEVQAIPGTVMCKEAISGKWIAATVSYKTYTCLTVNGTAVIHEASCDFSFTGTDGTNTVKGQSSVTLSATPTKLQGSSTKVLRDGDQNLDSFGNTLKVVATGKVTSG